MKKVHTKAMKNVIKSKRKEIFEGRRVIDLWNLLKQNIYIYTEYGYELSIIKKFSK